MNESATPELKMTSPDPAYIIFASVSLNSAPATNICSFPNDTTNERRLHPRASDLVREPCLWDLSSV